jgi:hypothetical protein
VKKSTRKALLVGSALGAAYLIYKEWIAPNIDVVNPLSTKNAAAQASNDVTSSLVGHQTTLGGHIYDSLNITVKNLKTGAIETIPVWQYISDVTRYQPVTETVTNPSTGETLPIAGDANSFSWVFGNAPGTFSNGNVFSNLWNVLDSNYPLDLIRGGTWATDQVQQGLTSLDNAAGYLWSGVQNFLSNL